MCGLPPRRSQAAPQELVNSGSLPLAGADVVATPWYIDLGGAMPAEGHQSLPASLTEVSVDGPNTGYRAVGGGDEISAADGLAGGQGLPLWFRIDLTGHAQVQGAELAQHVTYLAECGYRP